MSIFGITQRYCQRLLQKWSSFTEDEPQLVSLLIDSLFLHQFSPFQQLCEIHEDIPKKCMPSTQVKVSVTSFGELKAN